MPTVGAAGDGAAEDAVRREERVRVGHVDPAEELRIVGCVVARCSVPVDVRSLDTLVQFPDPVGGLLCGLR